MCPGECYGVPQLHMNSEQLFSTPMKQKIIMYRIAIVATFSLALNGSLMADVTRDSLKARAQAFGQVLPRQDATGLSASTLAGLRNIAGQLEKERHGACVLLHGAGDTGKVQAAGFIGSAVRRHVYRVDLTAVQSKYIGETEKNLDRVMEQAEKNDWILFFDEADALFGKCSEVKDTHDRYANIPTSYVLERLAHYKVFWFLASNPRVELYPAVTKRCTYQVKIQSANP